MVWMVWKDDGMGYLFVSDLVFEFDDEFDVGDDDFDEVCLEMLD